jgi:histidinol-phosphate/aromatic aminotransferase/cobyric acid decarboxylase-like protein
VIPPPGDHGGDGPRLAAALGIAPSAILDLSVSVNPFAPDVAALASPEVEVLRHYPDPAQATGALAEAMGVEHDQLLVTNGGSQAIALLAA